MDSSASTASASAPEFAPGLSREAYERYLPLVRRVALRTAQTLPPGLGYDQVLKAGFTGLSSALRARGNQSEEDFQTFAAYRVRLATLEFLRSQDPEARKLRGASLRITQAIGEFVARAHRLPEEVEVAAELGLELAAYGKLLEQISAAGWVRLELGTDDGSGLVMREDTASGNKELTGRVEGVIRALPEQYQVVLGLYYQEQCDHGEIADVLGISPGRACQMHAQAVHLIRGQLTGGLPC